MVRLQAASKRRMDAVWRRDFDALHRRALNTLGMLNGTLTQRLRNKCSVSLSNHKQRQS